MVSYLLSGQGLASSLDCLTIFFLEYWSTENQLCPRPPPQRGLIYLLTQWEPLIYTQLVRNVGINLELCSASAVGAVMWDRVLNLWTLWTPDCVRIEWKCRTTSMLENCLVVWGRQGSHTLELVSESLESKFFFGERLTLSPHSKPGPLFHHCSNFFFFFLAAPQSM